MLKFLEKDVVLISSSGVLIALLFLLFYLPTRSLQYVIVFSAMFVMLTGYAAAVIFSKFGSKQKIVMEMVPLMIFSTLLASFALYARVKLKGPITILDPAIILYVVLILCLIKIVALRLEKWRFEEDMLTIYRGAKELKYDLSTLFVIVERDRYTIFFQTKQDYLDYAKEYESFLKEKDLKVMTDNIRNLNRKYDALYSESYPTDALLAEIPGFKKRKDFWLRTTPIKVTES